MGLFLIRARFEGEPPSEATFRRELLTELGQDAGLEGFDADGNLVEVRTMLDAVTRPYAVKVLQRLGGTVVDPRTLEPSAFDLPAFVSRPWRAWPLWKRAAIHARFQLGLMATAVPQRIL